MKWIICGKVMAFGFMKAGSYYFSHHNKQKGNQDGIMRKIKQVAIIIGISAMVMVGCKGKESVTVTDTVLGTTKDTMVESTTKDNTSGANESKSIVEERWTKLRAGKSMEVNLNEKDALIGGFVKDGNDMYLAVRYNGESVTENAYCYFFSRYFEKGSDVYTDMKFTGNLDDVAEDIWSNGMAFWESSLGQQSGPFLNSSTLEIEVNSREIVELNGKKLLREEVLGKSTFMDVPKSSRFMAYYYLNEGGQGVCVFGDRSEEQTDATYENVKEVAEAIMSTFRE